jgi:DNA-directed RNA polymerase subunit RPC12/RpoP
MENRVEWEKKIPELRTCYCPICDKHFEVRSNDSMGDCPDCGHHVVLHRLEEVAE